MEDYNIGQVPLRYIHVLPKFLRKEIYPSLNKQNRNELYGAYADYCLFPFNVRMS